jgi:hypothetical protein
MSVKLMYTLFIYSLEYVGGKGCITGFLLLIQLSEFIALRIIVVLGYASCNKFPSGGQGHILFHSQIHANSYFGCFTENTVV